MTENSLESTQSARIVGVYRNINEPVWVSDLKEQVQPLTDVFALADDFRIHLLAQMELKQINTHTVAEAADLKTAIIQKIGRSFCRASDVCLDDKTYISERAVYVGVAEKPSLAVERSGVFHTFRQHNYKAYAVPSFSFRLKIGELQNKYKADIVQDAVDECLKDRLRADSGKIKII